MLFTWGKPDDVARTDFLHSFTILLDQAETSRDDEGLPQRVCVPRCTCAGLEGDAGTPHAGRFSSVE